MHFHLTSNVSEGESRLRERGSPGGHLPSNGSKTSHIRQYTFAGAKVYVAVLKFKHTVKKKKS